MQYSYSTINDFFTAIKIDDSELVNTILKESSEKGRRILLTAVDPEAPIDYAKTALEIVICDRSSSSLEFLLKYGADPNETNFLSGHNPLFAAVQNSDLESVKLLLEYGSDPNLYDDHCREPPLHRTRTVEILDALVEGGADMESQDFDEESALHTYAVVGFRDGVEYLLKKGVSPSPLNAKERTPLSYAIEYEETEIEELLREYTQLKN